MDDLRPKELHMISKPFKLARFLAVFTALALLGGVGQAQEKGEKHGKSGQTMSVTGCLAKGDEAGEYAITQDGKTYGLRSKNVKLADHLGHKVTVSGKFRPEKDASEKGKEAGDIAVTSLTMVSTACP